MKKIISVFLAMSILLINASAISVSAQSAVVIDCDTSDILFAKNENEIMTMASTTKIMTAIIALENADLEKEITIKKEYTLVEGSSMYLKEDEVLTMTDLIYGLMLMSGNDSAVAIANETTGDYDQFIELMNEKCVQLGLTNTSFKNPNGLDEEGHYTTAYELAIIAKYALENEIFREITSSKFYSDETRTMKNHNKMLWLSDDSIGVKTGYTMKSGRCLVSASEIDGKTLVAVTLNAPSDWQDHSQMLENSFSFYEKYSLNSSDEIFDTVSVQGGERLTVDVSVANDINLNLTKYQKENLNFYVNAEQIIYAPIKKGEIYGEIVYNVNSVEIFREKITYDDDVNYMLIPEMNLIEKFVDFIKNLFY